MQHGMGNHRDKFGDRIQPELDFRNSEKNFDREKIKFLDAVVPKRMHWHTAKLCS